VARKSGSGGPLFGGAGHCGMGCYPQVSDVSKGVRGSQELRRYCR
jgi:hypothetical protein